MPSFGFGKDLRLLDSSDFSAVFKQASLKASDSKFLILANLNRQSHPRLGLVISKKNVRLATERNRLKRLIRESFRLQQHKLPPIDAIVLARRGANELANSDIDNTLDRLWKRITQRAEQSTSP